MRNTAILAGLAAISFGLAQPALAGDGDWVKVSSSENGESVHWVDSTSPQRKGDVVSYRERAEINDEGSDWESVIALSQINCKSNLVHPVKLTITYANGKTETFDNPDPEDWNPIEPDSVGSDVRDYVCKT